VRKCLSYMDLRRSPPGAEAPSSTKSADFFDEPVQIERVQRGVNALVETQELSPGKLVEVGDFFDRLLLIPHATPALKLMN